MIPAKPKEVGNLKKLSLHWPPNLKNNLTYQKKKKKQAIDIIIMVTYINYIKLIVSYTIISSKIESWYVLFFLF